VSEEERLHTLLRKHGFIVGVTTDDDRKSTDALLLDLYTPCFRTTGETPP
jgi:hypothetical protein